MLDSGLNLLLSSVEGSQVNMSSIHSMSRFLILDSFSNILWSLLVSLKETIWNGMFMSIVWRLHHHISFLISLMSSWVLFEFSFMIQWRHNCFTTFFFLKYNFTLRIPSYFLHAIRDYHASISEQAREMNLLRSVSIKISWGDFMWNSNTTKERGKKKIRACTNTKSRLRKSPSLPKVCNSPERERKSLSILDLSRWSGSASSPFSLFPLAGVKNLGLRQTHSRSRGLSSVLHLRRV